MRHCWIPTKGGYTLYDESGAVVGEIIELPIQIHGQTDKRLKTATEWFRLHVHKIQENGEIGA